MYFENPAGFAQLRKEYRPVRAPGSAYRTVQLCRAVFRQRRGSDQSTSAKFGTKAFWNGRCYNVATLTCYWDLLLAICAFLF